MSERVTLELPDNVARSAREVATRTDRRLEDVLVEWIDHVVTELPVESLSDEEVLALCDSQMKDEQQEELSDLLARNREGELTHEQRARLDELMQVYRRGVVRKAEALKVAVERGLRPPLNQKIMARPHIPADIQQRIHEKAPLARGRAPSSQLAEEQAPQVPAKQKGTSMGLPRFHIQGHVYYITTVMHNRLPIFTRPSFIIPPYDSLNFYRYQQDFKLLGYVIMPDHIHLVLWPHGTATVSDVMRDYKEFTSKRIIRQAEVEGIVEWSTAFREAGQTTGRSQNKVWQDNYWDENVFTERFLRQKLNYIHRNPVRAGLVERPADYPYSSYRNYQFGEEWLIEIDRTWY